VSAPPGLTFPTDYPVKVLGRPDAEFRRRVHEIVLRHAPDLTAARLTERLSANGNYLALTYLLAAHSRAQLEALVAELKACEGVLLLL